MERTVVPDYQKNEPGRDIWESKPLASEHRAVRRSGGTRSVASVRLRPRAERDPPSRPFDSPARFVVAGRDRRPRLLFFLRPV